MFGWSSECGAAGYRLIVGTVATLQKGAVPATQDRVAYERGSPAIP